MRFCVFDLETRKLAQDLAPGDAGWEKLSRGEGGISALAIWDSLDKWTHVYDDADILEIAAHLEAADVVVGFRSEGFDRPVVEGLLGRKLVLKSSIDIHICVRAALDTLGLRGRRGEYTLGAICERTIGKKKLESGAHAPQLANEGRWGRLFRYCMSDVQLTLELYLHILTHGGIVSVDGTFLPIPAPQHLSSIIEEF